MDLRIEDLTVVVDGRELIRALDLTVAPGRVVGLVGPNGSGKSTALRCVYRALKPTSGVVRVGGDDVTDLSLRTSARRLAALSQDGEADFDFTVEEVVALGRAPHKRGNEPLTEAERDTCRAAMDQMHVRHLARRGILSLSGGEKQRVLVARALAQEPRVLILDEPTNHLDIRHQIDLLAYLRTCGLTTVLVLHDLNLAAATCDQLAVLVDGRLVATGSPQDVLTRPLIRAAFGVDVAVVEHPLTGDTQILFALGIDPSSTAPSRPTSPSSTGARP